MTSQGGRIGSGGGGGGGGISKICFQFYFYRSDRVVVLG